MSEERRELLWMSAMVALIPVLFVALLALGLIFMGYLPVERLI